MPNINSLIATGGGYTPPAFDLQTAQGNALRNQTMQQNLQMQPRRMQLAEEEMRLREVALDIKERALQNRGTGQAISLDYPGFTIKGTPEAVASIADAVAQFPEQAKDPKFLPWVASQGVTLERRDPKPVEDKSQTEEQLTRAALREALGREPNSQEILDAMQKRKIATAQAMPAPTVYVGEVGGKPAVTGGSKGNVGLKVMDTPGGQPLAPKGTEAASEKASEDEKKDVQALGNARDIITQLKTQWDAVAPESRGESSLLFTQARTGYHPDAKAYIDQREGLLGQLSRTIAAERGVLTNQDIDRISRLLPKIALNPLNADNKVEGDKKWKQILDILDKSESRMKKRLKTKTKSQASEGLNAPSKNVSGMTDAELLEALKGK